MDAQASELPTGKHSPSETKALEFHCNFLSPKGL